MDLPVYVTPEEVRRVCAELGLRDWTTITEKQVSAEEAAVILERVNAAGMPIDPADFRRGLQVELEHGTMYPDANVTNNHPLLTGKIVLAHLKESLDYYKRLDVMEAEGDLLQAAIDGNLERVRAKLKKLADLSAALNGTVSRQL